MFEPEIPRLYAFGATHWIHQLTFSYFRHCLSSKENLSHRAISTSTPLWAPSEATSPSFTSSAGTTSSYNSRVLGRRMRTMAIPWFVQRSLAYLCAHLACHAALASHRPFP